ncbi:DinB family protein [Aporhodopirellula aestuarii]|uniref:DinB family protein n=1 Tax=Aporhodopirellula aestuarii TaxID=2950107 RepID=A0ABT0UDJ0_9BACT|nr:DinB family protein [Aporhodopirellula aestuarii]MCM2375117.1 DinB family protein [Aporhodopirellula aestuarii]
MNENTLSGETGPVLPDVETAAVMLQAAIGQIRFARAYTLELLAATPQERWFEIPEGCVTNIAWQVGHLAVSQYGLLMFRIRGRRPEDLDLIPGRFRKSFGRGSVPPKSSEGQPSPEELLAKLNEVYQTGMGEIAEMDPAVLLDEVEMPYAVYPCKLGAILFCPMHETLHAGQIGVTRRHLGLEPVR